MANSSLLLVCERIQSNSSIVGVGTCTLCSSIVRGSINNTSIQTDARALSWYKLVTYLGVGRCLIYTASGPSALGCVNHASPCTSVCNLYMH